MVLTYSSNTGMHGLFSAYGRSVGLGFLLGGTLFCDLWFYCSHICCCLLQQLRLCCCFSCRLFLGLPDHIHCQSAQNSCKDPMFRKPVILPSQVCLQKCFHICALLDLKSVLKSPVFTFALELSKLECSQNTLHKA